MEDVMKEFDITMDEFVDRFTNSLDETKNAADKPPSGYMSFAELKESLQDIKSRQLARSKEKTLEDIMKEFDTDADTKVTVDEFVDRFTKWLDETKNALDQQPYRSIATYKDIQIELQKIVSATNNFADENLVMEGGFGRDYKGQLLQSGQLVDIVARRLDRKYENGDVEFLTEVSVLYGFKHKNIVSIIGFCDEKDEKIIVYEHALHGRLNQHLHDPTLTWFQRLQICLGVARALSYIHYDVIHCGIDSSKIFLDKDWEPKVFGFEFSTKYPQSWKHRLRLSRYFDTRSMTPKDDVYSFGVLLFEVLSGSKPTICIGGVNEKLDEVIHPKLREQMVTQSLAIVSNTAYNCLNQQRVECPTMDQIVKELEEALELQWIHDNIEHSVAAAGDEGTSANRLKVEWLKIPLSEIWLATENFSDTYYVGYGAFGKVYKANLDVLDIQSLSSMEGKSKDELPRISKAVAIKRIFSRQDEIGKQGFFTEIELLSRCNHPNIVSLLGFSMEGGEMILVYEYAFKGSLDNNYLGSTGKKVNLTWEQRLRICLDIAQGLNYLHNNMEGKPRIIHRDIKSENILLDEKLNAKVADFGLSKFQPLNQQESTILTKNIAGTEFYMDPEYSTTYKYKKESDIYSFGVVLFEILSGRLAYDMVYTKENDRGLAPIARQRFNEGTLKELIDLTMIEEDDENIFTLNRGPNQDSFVAFSKIAYQCLAETQAKRPTMEVVIKELQNALKLQGETMVLSRFRLSDIVLATTNFSETHCIGLDAYGMVYKAELLDFDDKSSLAVERKNDGELPKRRITVAVKRIINRVSGQGKERFFAEIEKCSSYKHPNIASLIGFCDEGDEMILLYEHASNNSLEDILTSVDNMNNLTWMQRLHMCLEIARGLNHLHTKMDGHQSIIHGDIKSANILLGKNREAKIAYFGISKLNPPNQEASNLFNNNGIDTKVYWDPVYEKTGTLKNESDIYSFGVVLFEIFCGRLAYDSIYIAENEKGLAPIARRCFSDGTIKKMIDPKLKEATDEDIFTSNRGPNQNSLDTYSKIAYQCLGEAQANRPTMESVIKELEIALNFQENLVKSLQMSLKDIESATENFNQKNCIRRGRYWNAYKGEIANANANANGHITIVAKRWDSKFVQGGEEFWTELDILFKHKHENIIGLVGYCNERNETIIVYEHASNGGLNEHLDDVSLTWMKRLEISINVARGLEFLHGGAVTLKKVVHRDIKSPNILLFDDWKAKISNFELSSLDSLHRDTKHVSDNTYGAVSYLDPGYTEQGYPTQESDIYSFGLVLFEILCGRLAWVEACEDPTLSLGPLAKHYFAQGKLDEMVFEGIKGQIDSKSLTTFAEIAYQCLHDDGDKRPKASEVVIQLKKALAFQEDSAIWEPKLPSDYRKIIWLSVNPEIYYTETKKDLYKILSNGIFLQKEKVWFVISDHGKANKMISAITFSYENRESHKWRCIHKSRFQKVAKILDSSSLKIQIMTNNRFLSPGVIYGVRLVFKFCNSRKYSSKPVYINLRYRNGRETLYSHFATWGDGGWMTTELWRFLNDKEDIKFEVLLESLSRYYCGSDGIYVQGIEFRAIENVAHDDIVNLNEVQEVQKSNFNMDQVHHLPTNNGEVFKKSENQDEAKTFLLSEVNGKKHLMLSSKKVLYNSPKMKPFELKSSAESRFQDVMELLPQQVFRIKYKIESQMLSPFTEYACYLVFKLSEKCRGLHCPVKVQDLLHRRNKETKVVYFRSPAPSNKQDADWIPEHRKDGWMEVMVWMFNPKSMLGKNNIPMNLKLITYEGTMSGLIICGLEFRPV